MAYKKVCDSQGGPTAGEALDCVGGLDPEWDVGKEEVRPAELSLDRTQPQQHLRRHTSGGSDSGPDREPDLLEPMQPSVSISSHGRFERLQEDPNYTSNFTRAPANKGQRIHRSVIRYLLVGGGLFAVGVLTGWLTHPSTINVKVPAPPTDGSDLLEELLKGITAGKIDALQRSFSSQSDEDEETRARYLYRQWAGLGLTDVRLHNQTVLLSLAGSAPNTVTDQSSHQCFLPSGVSCDHQEANDPLKRRFSYAAYSANGVVQGALVDVQYGSVKDFRAAEIGWNLTNHIALLKLGHAPLLYKLSQLSALGFGGVLLYVDPCDAPPGRPIRNQAFRVTLNPGGNPAAGRLTSLLVQPISARLARTLLSAPPTAMGGACIPLATPPHTEPKQVRVTVENQLTSRTVYSVVGRLEGRTNPDRYVLVGSRHDDHQGGGSSAIINQLIAALTEQTKKGWQPDRTTVFCSWGGSALGNIGSFEWGKVNSVVLQSSAVAYVSLNSPVRGTGSLRATASPSLLQLTTDIQTRQLLSCIRGGHCPVPTVTSLQLPGDVSFFANQLAVPTVEFAFEGSKVEETTSFLEEAQFPPKSPQTVDPLFKFHETIAKMTAEAVFRLVSDPVLPFFPLDVALNVQTKLKEGGAGAGALLTAASSLRDRAAFLQSEVMRPANDPKERDPAHVRMLNDVLRDLEKSFILPQAPPGVYRNALYSLPGQTGFSILRFSEEAPEGPAPPFNQTLSLITRAVQSARTLLDFGLDLFENDQSGLV